MKPQKSICLKCQKDQHSEKLWDLHEIAVEQGRYCSEHGKNENLYPITIGLGRTTISRICRFGPDPDDVKLIPIYMSCVECGLYLGSIEEDYADVLGQTCLKCFRELIGQADIWYDILPVVKKEVANC